MHRYGNYHYGNDPYRSYQNNEGNHLPSIPKTPSDIYSSVIQTMGPNQTLSNSIKDLEPIAKQEKQNAISELDNIIKK